MQNNKKIVIIEAGIAGLCAAVYARKCGYDVDVFEQHGSAGGLATSWRRGTYGETCNSLVRTSILSPPTIGLGSSYLRTIVTKLKSAYAKSRAGIPAGFPGKCIEEIKIEKRPPVTSMATACPAANRHSIQPTIRTIS
jgi:heterodisulfide reductase subunit A-like polyferredoxin